MLLHHSAGLRGRSKEKESKEYFSLACLSAIIQACISAFIGILLATPYAKESHKTFEELNEYGEREWRSIYSILANYNLGWTLGFVVGHVGLMCYLYYKSKVYVLCH